MTGFDPDAYLASKSKTPSTFDPDAYLASRVPAKKFGDPGVGDPDVPGYTPTPEEQAQTDALNSYDNQMAKWSTEHPHQKIIRDVVGLGLETALPMVGGILGGAAGSLPGGIAGAGVGYGTAKQAEKAMDQFLFKVPMQSQSLSNQIAEPVYNTLLGATMEAGGRVVIPAAVNVLSKGTGKVIDAFTQGPSKQEAVRIARQSVEEGKLPQVINALKGAEAGEAPANALTRQDLNVPVTQSLLKHAESQSPTYFTDKALEGQADDLATLSRLAKGQTRTEAKIAAQTEKNILNNTTQPERNRVLRSANVTSNVIKNLENESALNTEAATQSVDDVRRLALGKEKAEALANGRWDESKWGPEPKMTEIYKPSGMPRVPGRYTHQGELAQLADSLMDDAANGSLKFGQARNLANDALADLESQGLKPLTAEQITPKLQAKLKDPEFAGNDMIKRAMVKISNDLGTWTKNNGVIDAFALDSIRKNSVNSVIQKLMPGAEKKAQNRAAAELMSTIKPILVDAVETAGGKGYGQYLESYAKGMKDISRTKLSSELMTLYKSNPTEFAKAVGGERPDLIEKFMGPGDFDIKKVMPSKDFEDLSKIASKITNQQTKMEQAAAGEKKLTQILEKNRIRFRLPNFLNMFTSGTNKALDVLESHVNKKTLDILSKSAKSAKSFEELLSTVPTSERNKILKAMADPDTFAKMIPSGSYAAGLNSLAPTQQENRNALAK